MSTRSLATAAIVAAAFAAGPALAATAPAQPPDTWNGARPGNVIGTDNSLPTSNQASNIVPSDVGSAIAPRLPDPSYGQYGAPTRYLRTAVQALHSRHTGAAQQALEMAETRLLDRSVSPGAANQPDGGPAVQDITAALHTLAHGNLSAALLQTHLAIADVGAHRIVWNVSGWDNPGLA